MIQQFFSWRIRIYKITRKINIYININITFIAQISSKRITTFQYSQWGYHKQLLLLLWIEDYSLPNIQYWILYSWISNEQNLKIVYHFTLKRSGFHKSTESAKINNILWQQHFVAVAVIKPFYSRVKLVKLNGSICQMPSVQIIILALWISSVY